MLKFLSKIFGTKNDRELKRVQPIVDQINAMEESFKAMSDEELKAVTPRFKQKLDNGASLDDILPAAYAAVRETGRRVLGMRHYNVQLIGGIFLHQGHIAEMRTGEGKTLVATLPCYLNALEGKGVHLITVNDYLAARDAEWMGRIHNFLGLSVGTILNDISDNERKAAYNCDITYGTNNEFGFDYLRDNMKYSLDRKVQRYRNFAIVDEVDSILIDEARTPLIISGRAEQSTELYFTINKVIPFLKRDEDYIVDEEHHSATLTDEGVERVEKHLSLDNLYEPANIEYLHHVNKALQAHTLYKKDVNYIVDDGQVVIVDEHTGRPMPGRRWSDGLHQAVEAKEGVSIRDENHTLATITFQNFFRMYDKLSGMTGTAETEAEEFKEIYELDVRVIPTNRPIQRLDMNDVIYRTEREKFKAIVDQILECHGKGQPVLVGTVSVDKSDAISKVLRRKRIKHSVLNAKFHRSEAEIVAQAGRKGAITIATNMAGRGTDILLGGSPEDLAKDAAGTEEGPEFEAQLEHFKEVCAKEKQEVLDAGGLFILGTERHESRRIDNQLRGRAGRQGDPGAARFFLSLEDDLLRIFGAERISYVMEKLDMPEGEPIEANMVSKSIENAQRRVEGRNFDIRKNLLEYDDVMNQQRKTIYEMRDKVLAGGEPLYDMTLDVFDRAAVAMLNNYCPEKVRADEWDVEGLSKEARERFDLEEDFTAVGRRDQLGEKLWKAIEDKVAHKVEELQYIADRSNERFAEVEEYEPKTGRDIFLELIQNTYLKAIDFHWREHLKQMDALRDAIRFQGYAQKDPKKVYKIEGYDCFERTMLAIDNQVVEYLTKIEVEREDQVQDIAPKAIRIRAVEVPKPAPKPEPTIAAAPSVAPTPIAAMPQAMAPPVEPKEAQGGTSESDDEVETARRSIPKIGRNDPCPCGSGKKFKRCHMGKEDALEAFL
ncbi:MAG: preprotein translocase subunit SecA [Myxococcales bacterium]|nr:preprotein translocase subunit SecA [Myxococcales bacterium]